MKPRRIEHNGEGIDPYPRYHMIYICLADNTPFEKEGFKGRLLILKCSFLLNYII